MYAPLVALLATSSLAHAQERDHGVRPFPPLAETRAIDGSGNHLVDTERGAILQPMARELSVDYADAAGAPGGSTRPSARVISNAVAAQSSNVPNARGVSDLFWQWGQFLDHDITETPVHSPAESFPIPVPPGDPYFDPFGTGIEVIPLGRSFPVRVDGRREQINGITSWIDGSQIYGSDKARAEELRTLDGTGQLKTSDGDLLPFNVNGFANAPSDALTGFFLAGDVRANEQVGLTAMHVLFMREHNHWARVIREEDREWFERRRGGARGSGGNGGSGGGRSLTREGFESGRLRPLDGDEIYELARAIVSAELQLVTYREWLPLLLGEGALPPDAGYLSEIDGTIRNEFATAAFRLGHSMLSTSVLRLDRRGREISAGHLSLSDAFFSPDEIIATGIDPVLRGLAAQRAQELDVMVVDDIRNFLFGPPGAGGLDLASLNIQRGRDHGLPSLAQARRDLGLGAPLTLDGVSSDPSVIQRLRSIARTPEDLDLWVGGLAEDPVPGALVGETFHEILLRQFVALRDGDRLWYTRQLPRHLQERVEAETLARIVRRGSGLGSELAANPFLAP